MKFRKMVVLIAVLFLLTSCGQRRLNFIPWSRQDAAVVMSSDELIVTFAESVRIGLPLSESNPDSPVGIKNPKIPLVRFSRDQNKVAFSVSDGKNQWVMYCVYSPSEQEWDVVGPVTLMTLPLGKVNSLEWSPDGRYLAVAICPALVPCEIRVFEATGDAKGKFETINSETLGEWPLEVFAPMWGLEGGTLYFKVKPRGGDVEGAKIWLLLMDKRQVINPGT